MNDFDFTIFLWLNSWVGISAVLDRKIIFFGQYFLYALIAAAPLFYFFDKNENRARRAIMHAFFAGILSRFVFAEAIRFFYERARPFEILEGVKMLIMHEASPAFPSGHASFSFALASAVYYYYPKTGALFFIGAIFMGISRVVAGIHWPLDILGGAIAGILAAWLVNFFIGKKIK